MEGLDGTQPIVGSGWLSWFGGDGVLSGIWVVGEWKGKGMGGGEVDGLDGEVLCGRVFDMGIMPLYIAKAFSLYHALVV